MSVSISHEARNHVFVGKGENWASALWALHPRSGAPFIPTDAMLREFPDTVARGNEGGLGLDPATVHAAIQESNPPYRCVPYYAILHMLSLHIQSQVGY